MGYKSPHMYSLALQSGTGTPADSTVYYMGNQGGLGWTTVANISRLFALKSGIIRKCYINMYTGTTGTAEDIVMVIRINNATDYTFATVGAATGTRIFSNYALSIRVTEGDGIEIKITTPAWVTNPDNVKRGGEMLIECE